MFRMLAAGFARVRSREVLVFGLVGLLGYVTDLAAFNLLRYAGGGLLHDKPLTAKVVSVTIAMVVTYLGNKHWTWRDRRADTRRREYLLFAFFNVVGMLIAVGCLAFSHYLLGLRSPLADNISANFVGLALGTAFRFWSYRTYVFAPAADTEPVSDRTASADVR